MTQDLLGNEMSASEERLLAVYEELKALCDRGPAAGRRVERPRRAGARAQAVNGLALEYEHLSDLGV